VSKGNLKSNDPSFVRDYVIENKAVLGYSWGGKRHVLYMLGKLTRRCIYEFKEHKDPSCE